MIMNTVIQCTTSVWDREISTKFPLDLPMNLPVCLLENDLQPPYTDSTHHVMLFSVECVVSVHRDCLLLIGNPSSCFRNVAWPLTHSISTRYWCSGVYFRLTSNLIWIVLGFWLRGKSDCFEIYDARCFVFLYGSHLGVIRKTENIGQRVPTNRDI